MLRGTLFQIHSLLLIIFFTSTAISVSSTKEIKFKGWLDTEFKGDNKEDTKSYFDVDHLYLMTEVNLDEGFSGFAEIEFEHAPNTDNEKGQISLDRLYSQKVFSDYFGLRFGKFSTPFGYWTPTHWAILTETVSKPLHELNKYIPSKSVGFEAFGNIFLQKHEFEWKLFFSNGSEIEGTDEMDDKSFGGGADLRFVHANGNSFVGSSIYHQHNPQKDGRTERSFVGYGGITLGDFDMRSEFIYQDRSNGVSGVEYNNIATFYVTGKYQVSPDIAIGTRYDDGDDERNFESKIHTMTSLFLNWTPISEIIGKVEYDFHSSDNVNYEDYNSWALYLGLIF